MQYFIRFIHWLKSLFAKKPAPEPIASPEPEVVPEPIITRRQRRLLMRRHPARLDAAQIVTRYCRDGRRVY